MSYNHRAANKKPMSQVTEEIIKASINKHAVLIHKYILKEFDAYVILLVVKSVVYNPLT